MKLLNLAAGLLVMGMLFAATANAAVLYTDGPVNGTYSAWTINFGFQVEDSFSLAASSTLTGVDFGNWLFGNTASTVDWAIVGTEGSQTAICGACSGTAALTAGTSFTNTFGATVVDQSFSLPDLSLGSGTYWLELQNLVTSDGQPGYWDMNGGPSLVWENTLGDQSSNCSEGNGGATCSDSFDILGTAGSLTAVPEPISLSMFGAGLLGLGFIYRRRSVKRAF